MRTSVKQQALRLDETLKCSREPLPHGSAFIVRDGHGAELGRDHWDAASAWRAAYRILLAQKGVADDNR